MPLEIHYNVYGCFRPPAEDIDLAKAAVDAGFEGIWIGDHFLPWIDSRPYTHHPFPWLGALMNEIPDVPVGTSVTCPTMRYRPPLIAQAVATLDNMYPDRFHLGVGVGEALNEAHFVEEWPDWGTRAGMLIEAIEVMRDLWNSEDYVSYDGDHFEYDGIKLYTPPRKKIDVHWAGWGPTSCRYAGRFADHLLTPRPWTRSRRPSSPTSDGGWRRPVGPPRRPTLRPNSPHTSAIRTTWSPRSAIGGSTSPTRPNWTTRTPGRSKRSPTDS